MAEKGKKAKPTGGKKQNRRDWLDTTFKGVTAVGALATPVAAYFARPATVVMFTATSGAIIGAFSDLKYAYGGQCEPPVEGSRQNFKSTQEDDAPLEL